MTEDEQCPHCGDGENAPDGYFVCPVCDAEYMAQVFDDEDAPQ